MPYVQILDVPVPQLGGRVVDLLREIHTPALVEQVIAVPKISLDSAPQRSVCRRSRRAEQLVEVPTIVSYSSPQQRTAKQTVDIPVPHGRGDRGGGGVYKVHAQDRIQQCLWSSSLTFQFLMVVVDGSVMEKVSPWDRVLQRFLEQITLTLQFLRVVAAMETLKASSRVLLALHPRTRLVPWMRLLLGFSHLSPNQKKCGVGSALGVGTGCGLSSMDSGGLRRLLGARGGRAGDGVGVGVGAGGGRRDSLRRWVSADAGLHAVPGAPHGSARTGVCRRAEVPPTQFILGVADVPVVQSIPQVQSWSTSLLCWSPWRHAGVGVWQGQEAVCSFLQAGGRSSSHR